MIEVYNHFIERSRHLDEALRNPEVFRNFSDYEFLLREKSFLSPIVRKVEKLERLFIDKTEMEELKSVSDEVEVLELIEDILKIEKEIIGVKDELDHYIRQQQTETVNPPKQHPQPNELRSSIELKDLLKKVKSSEWTELREKWIEHVPFIDSTVHKEKEKIEDWLEFETLIQEVEAERIDLGKNEKNSKLYFKKKINKRIRSMVFEQALFTLHKASHIISAGELQAKEGIKTWSLSSSYQGSLLAAKAIINLFGISLVKVGKKTFIINVFAINNQNLNLSENEVCIDIIPVNQRMAHKETWTLFVRIISSFKVRFWQKDLINYLKGIKTGDFSKQRNNIHYWNNSWIFDDLFEYDYDPTFGIYENPAKGISEFNIKSDFSLILGLNLLRMANLLLYDLSGLTNNLRKELETIDKFLYRSNRHPYYERNF